MSAGQKPSIVYEKTSSRHEFSTLLLVNSHNISVKLITKGASVFEVCAPDKNGEFTNIAMQLARPEQYGGEPGFAGVTLGPSVGRIPGGQLPIGSQTVQLSLNEGDNHLHGGMSNLSQMDWDVLETGSSDDAAWAVLGVTLRDGLDGYPGFRHITVKYTLDNQDALTLAYRAKTDKLSYIVLSNHSYWNLSGNFTRSIQNHRLTVAATRVWHNDSAHLPKRLAAVEHTPFDFRRPAMIGEQMKRYPDDEQLLNARGYNNAYLLDGEPAATLEHPASGRRMVLTTNYPALVFYSGGYLAGSTQLAGGIAASPGCALALEPQEHPVLPNMPRQPLPVLHPGETWQRWIRFAFGVV